MNSRAHLNNRGTFCAGKLGMGEPHTAGCLGIMFYLTILGMAELPGTVTLGADETT